MPQALPADRPFRDRGVEVRSGVGVAPELLKGEGPVFIFIRGSLAVQQGLEEGRVCKCELISTASSRSYLLQ